MTAYIENWCPNPSFETNLSGWNALGGTSVAQDATWAAYGQQAMLMTTDGAAAGEGFYGPPVAVSATGPCSVSLSLLSVTGGNVTISAVSGVTGTVFASVTAELTDVWQRLQVSGFTVASGDSFYLAVTTTTAQALLVWADGAQMEIGVSSASPYIDGDQQGCEWIGVPELSASVQPYQNSSSASGEVTISGNADPVQVGEKFSTSASGAITISGDAAPTSAPPVAAFTDFAIFELADPDPAMSYADQNNAATHSGHTTWAQSYGVFYPPLDYPVSNGSLLWKRAAYMALGLRFTSVANNQEQHVTLAQVALAPVTGSAAVPQAYIPPRQLQAVIKPSRLNYCTNPAFAVSAAGWSGSGTGTIAQDTTTATPTPEWLTTAQAGALALDYNSVAISSDGTTGTGNFDGAGYSYSAAALAAAGLVPGGVVASGGLSYILPYAGAGQADSISADGQTVPFPTPGGATVLGFFGASAGGGTSGVSGTVTVTYTDGTSVPVTLGFTDWTLAAGASSVLFGNQVAAALPYRNNLDGIPSPVATYLFTQTVEVDPTKAVASITLPDAPGLHILAVSAGEPSGMQQLPASGKVTVNASGDGTQITLADLITGDTYTASVYLQAGAGLQDINAACSGSSVDLSALTDGIPYGGEPGIGYGQGPYGGVEDGSPYDGGLYGAGVYGGTTNDLVTGVWSRVSFTFTATSPTVTLIVTALPGPDISYPTDFWVTGVLVEPGTELGDYFDGSYGSSDYLDYQWEGTAGLSRSYYYPQYAVKKYTIAQILAKHTPIGVTVATPQYLTTPEQ